MMIGSVERVREEFKSLREDYQQQLPNKMAQIESSWHQLVKAGFFENPLLPETKAEWEQFHCLIHRLVGSSATFGLMGLSETARMLESEIKEAIASERPLTADGKQSITRLLETLKLAARDGENGKEKQRVSPEIPLYSPDGSWREGTLVFLLEDDGELSENLAVQLSFFGYRVRQFKQLSGVTEAIAKTPPAALITDIMWPEGQLAGIEIIKEIRQECLWPLPVLFISAQDNMMARLQAVRAGGSAYFPKPVDIGSLIDKLDALTACEIPDPARILIVEDDAILARYYATVLQQASMMTAVAIDPMQVMQPLVDFKPDLILMDMYMPGCNGLELASVIRQQDAYVSIPIVFLSVETNVEPQLAAMDLGGDEFLTKPIEPSHLIAEVKSRVRRSRILNSYMVKDSLTGLFNHTKTKEQLSIEVARAKRQRTPLSFAMIDIDCFKSVNDVFGHLIGDRAIRSLSRLLQQRLRKTDIIGRYGGEEFAIIFPDTTATAAAKVLNEIREGFAKVRQQAKDREFSVTFSGGVAGFPDYTDANSLNEAADKALYRAKHTGRNRVAIASVGKSVYPTVEGSECGLKIY